MFAGARAVGVEFDVGVIRACEVRSRSHPVVVKCGQIDVMPDAIADGVVVDEQAVQKALNRLWRDAKFSTRNVVVGVANQGVLMRVASFPRLADRKLKAAISYQAAEHFPIPMSQLVMDFEAIGSDDEKNEVEVLLVAGRRDMINAHLSSVVGAGLHVKAVDASVLGLMRTVSPELLDGRTAVVNIGYGLTSVLMVSAGAPRLGRLMQSSLLDYFERSGMSCDDIKSVTEGSESERVITDWLYALASELQSTIGYLASQERGQFVDQVVVSGVGAGYSAVSEALSDQLGMKVEVSDLSSCVRLSGKMKDMSRVEQTEYAVCVGLALRGLEE